MVDVTKTHYTKIDVKGDQFNLQGTPDSMSLWFNDSVFHTNACFHGLNKKQLEDLEAVVNAALLEIE